jgi:acyl carrier protein
VSNVVSNIQEHLRLEFLPSHPGIEITGDLNLLDAEIVDSLGIMLLVDYLQEQFEIAIAPEEVTIDNFETLDAIVALVNQKLAAR